MRKKTVLFLLLLTGTFAKAQYKVVTCSSGDCQNGTGKAVVHLKDDNDPYVYQGSFKDGLPDGKGVLINNSTYERYTGNFKKGEKKGMGMQAHYRGDTIASTSFYKFQNHQDNETYTEAELTVGGVPYFNNIKKRKVRYDVAITDKDLVAYADDYLRGRGLKTFTEVRAEYDKQLADKADELKNNVVDAKSLELPEEMWTDSFMIDMLTGRNYYPTFEYSGRSKPPGESVFSFRIYGPDGSLLRDGADDWGETYTFTPPASGRYRVAIKYHQNKWIADKFLVSVAKVNITIHYHKAN